MNNKSEAGLYGQPGVIRTFTGIYIDVFDPKPEDICIEDIAHALSNICRFGGHTDKHYSVAEHSFRVAMVVSEENELAALLHDASEAYLMDIPTPIKKALPDYYKWEYRLMEVIAEKFGFQYPFTDEVKRADELLLHTEWSEMMTLVEGYEPETPESAKELFMYAFNQITARP